ARVLVALMALTAALASAGGATSVRALDCAPRDYICQELANMQASQAAAQARLARIQTQMQDVQQKSHEITLLVKSLDAQIVTEQKAIDATGKRIDEL